MLHIRLISISTLMLPLLVAAADVPARLTYLEQQNAQLRQTLLVQKKQNAQLRRKVLAQALKMSELQKDIQSLQGQIEVLNHHLEWVTKLQKEMKLELDNRLREIQQPLAKKVTTPPPSHTQTPASPEPQKPAFTDHKEKQAYQQIFELVQTGRYDSAIAELKKFLGLYPQSNKAYEAQYWLAQMYYSQKKINLALTAFSTLLEKYPNSLKQPDALLKIGYIYYEKKDYATARAIFQQVIETYPGTVTANLAEKRLQESKALK
ncbi:MAG: tol-pal system protein YbgF [Pseudomonadota bacterium]